MKTTNQEEAEHVDAMGSLDKHGIPLFTSLMVMGLKDPIGRITTPYQEW